jgi:hypothetical protein
VLHLVGHPSTFDSMAPSRARETLFSVVVEGLRRRSEHGPIVMWLDDLQWADRLVIDLLGRITRSLVDRAVLVVTAQRDDVDIGWPPSTDHPITIRMPLDPLSRDEAHVLVEAMLGDANTPALADQLYERSGGNPLFLTELASLTCVDPDSTTLPGSLRALIASRLDRLPPGPRAVLDNASVLGTSGAVKSLQHFAVELGQELDPADIDALVDDGFPDVTEDEYGGTWRFRSDVVREVAYQTLTKLVRAQRHAGTASVMGQIANSPIDQIAHHAATAAELVAEIGPVPGVPANVSDHAVRLLLGATQRALDVGAINQAQRHATRALDLVPSDPLVAPGRAVGARIGKLARRKLGGKHDLELRLDVRGALPRRHRVALGPPRDPIREAAHYVDRDQQTQIAGRRGEIFPRAGGLEDRRAVRHAHFAAAADQVLAPVLDRGHACVHLLLERRDRLLQRTHARPPCQTGRAAIVRLRLSAPTPPSLCRSQIRYRCQHLYTSPSSVRRSKARGRHRRPSSG